MRTEPIFCVLSSQAIAGLIRRAQKHVCYLAPGIQDECAEALIELMSHRPKIIMSISVDFDERTLRMGYGSLEAVERLRTADIPVTQNDGMRSAVLIVDHSGWVFSPIARYLEAEPQSDTTPNALRLAEEQVQGLLLRLSPEIRRQTLAQVEGPEQAAQIQAIPFEGGRKSIKESDLNNVKEAITLAPPVNFDVARQVRVFEPYLQYVELSLTGAHIERKRVTIPKELQELGSSADLTGRLRTTFDLVETSAEISSTKLNNELNTIRKNFTRSLGKDHGRVVLKSAKPLLVKRLDDLRKKLEEHQKIVDAELQAMLEKSRKDVVDHYLPLAKKNLPDAVIGNSWEELSRVRQIFENGSRTNLSSLKRRI